MELFDTHAHYAAPQFDEDRDELLSSFPAKGIVGVLNAGCCPESSRANIAMAEKYPFCWASVGIHPEDCGRYTTDDLSEIEALAAHPKVVAIGEIGLDYHFPDVMAPKEIQRDFFERQMDMANRLGLPVIIHARDCQAECFELVKKHRPRGVYHCYSGSPEMAKEIVKLGLYISFTGPVTFKNAERVRRAASAVPPDRLMIETDCPYLAPEPFRGRRNDSSYVYRVAEVLAELHGMTAEEMAAQTTENARRFLGIRQGCTQPA